MPGKERAGWSLGEAEAATKVRTGALGPPGGGGGGGELNPALLFQISSFLQLLPPGTGDTPVLAISIFISIPEEMGRDEGDEMSHATGVTLR